ncbi:MAG: hypothetical protein RR575_00010 [Acinetobacter sp.]
MRVLQEINFYLTKPIYEELVKEYKWARRIHNLNRKPVYLKLFLHLLYFKKYIPKSYQEYSITTPTPNGLDPLLTEEQVILLIQSSKLIGLPELSYLATSLHQENKQNKL